MKSGITLAMGQTWHPRNGERDRQIDDYCAADLRHHGYPMGTLLVLWASSASVWGWCTARSFKAWIKRTDAAPLQSTHSQRGQKPAQDGVS